jgi:hypothetical protein
MIVLNQNAVAKIEPVVRTAAGANGVLLQRSQARRRLTGVPQLTIGTLKLGHDRGCHAGDTAEMRQKVEGDALSSQDRVQQPFYGREDVTGRDAIAILLLATPHG